MNAYRLLLLVAWVALVACGQKGPLYMPGEAVAESQDSQIQDKKDRSEPVPLQTIPSSP